MGRVFWGGVFAFVTASVQAIKSGIETIRGARSSTGMCCFEAGTPVLTESGYKLIEDIAVGDKVLAYDEETGERGYKEVVRLFRNKTREWCHVYIEGQEDPIVSTSGHKYYLPENEDYREINEQQEHEGYETLNVKWVSARNLQKGDKVMLCDGRYGIVSEMSIERLAEPEITYNFEVEGCHTYYVGEQGVLVHNKCGETIEPDIGNKLDYAFGKAKGNVHNIQRSLDNASQLGKIGIHDNSTGRQLLVNHFKSVFYFNQSNIMGAGGRVTINSLLLGPGGFINVKSIWDRNKLITFIFIGG